MESKGTHGSGDSAPRTTLASTQDTGLLVPNVPLTDATIHNEDVKSSPGTSTNHESIKNAYEAPVPNNECSNDIAEPSTSTPHDPTPGEATPLEPKQARTQPRLIVTFKLTRRCGSCRKWQSLLQFRRSSYPYGAIKNDWWSCNYCKTRCKKPRPSREDFARMYLGYMGEWEED